MTDYALGPILKAPNQIGKQTERKTNRPNQWTDPCDGVELVPKSGRDHQRKEHGKGAEGNQRQSQLANPIARGCCHLFAAAMFT
jgi:hypothetical protein